MANSKRSAELWTLVMAALVIGPGTAVLHETGMLSLGPTATLWPIGFIVMAALAGLATGLRVATRVSKVLGALVVIPNFVVLGFYGFLLLFFGLGGSR